MASCHICFKSYKLKHLKKNNICRPKQWFDILFCVTFETFALSKIIVFIFILLFKILQKKKA